MGYVCPVCDAGVVDTRQLADHVAVTASLGRADHLEWLESHAPEWESSTREELAAVVTEYALEMETPVSEDDPEGPRPSSPGQAQVQEPMLEDAIARQSRGPGRGELTGTAESVLEEAMAMTREMESTDGEADDEDAGAADSSSDDGSGSSSPDDDQYSSDSAVDDDECDP
ncbi:DUF5810 domain-containing protein [Natronosalvus vescus]|uniref:DUF5810 domain-containing protein n=1 Tax=Natronosalvus vescus TaxID=2953881 RepID=UPI002090699C|nr:DUF5810 domain-containing protein [Natronosalvus vescus]